MPFQYWLVALFRMFTRTVPTATLSLVVPVMVTGSCTLPLLAGAVIAVVGAVVSGEPDVVNVEVDGDASELFDESIAVAVTEYTPAVAEPANA